MSWKDELRLSDIDGAMRLEIRCKHCGICRHYSAQDFKALDEK